MLVQAESLVALALLAPTVAASATAIVVTVPAWIGWIVFAVGVLGSFGAVMWWGETRIRAARNVDVSDHEARLLTIERRQYIDDLADALARELTRRLRDTDGAP